MLRFVYSSDEKTSCLNAKAGECMVEKFKTSGWRALENGRERKRGGILA